MNAAVNTTKTLTPDEMLQAARLMVLNRAPYHANVLLRLVPVRSPDFTYNGVPTFAVTEHGRMLWNPAAIEGWWKRDGAEACAGVLVHEALHFLLNHAARARAVGANTAELRGRWNTAADLSINTMLKAGGWKLPAGGLMPSQFGFAESLTAEAYWHLLSQQQQGKGQQQGQQGGDGDGNDGDGQGNGGPQQGQQGGGKASGKGQQGKGQQGAGKGAQGHGKGVGHGACGGCAGNPGPGEPADDGDASTDISAAEGDGLRRAVAQAVAQALAKSAGRGDVPGELQVLLESLKPAKVSWEQHLQRAVRIALSARRGVTDFTRSKLSRRQWGIGVGVGKPLLSAMHAPIPQVVFACDTSGSVGDDELVRAASEVEGLCRALSAPLQFIAADTRISSRGTVRSARDLKGLMTGRGGTDFRPVFDTLSREGFNGLLVYATDGDGPAPAQAPKGMHVVWLLFGKTARVPASYGTAIRVEND